MIWILTKIPVFGHFFQSFLLKDNQNTVGIWIVLHIYLSSIQMSGIQMAFTYQTIWWSDNFWSFEYQTGLVFRSQLHGRTNLDWQHRSFQYTGSGCARGNPWGANISKRIRERKRCCESSRRIGFSSAPTIVEQSNLISKLRFFNYYYPPSTRIYFCVRTIDTVMCLHTWRRPAV